MREPILVPDLGAENVVLSVWYVKPGEEVFRGDRLVELLLGSATFDVTAATAGMLVEQCAGPQDRLVPGEVLGFVQTTVPNLDP
jgi:pyruvate/2-oxoglutarate dehydrogenase complex dihydrolipoamide acyltransferase (E2) component